MNDLIQLLRDTRLDGDRAPLLRDALEGLFEVVRSADLDPRVVFGANSPITLLNRNASVGAWLQEQDLLEPSWGHAIDEQSLRAWLGGHADASGWVERHLVPDLLLRCAAFPHASGPNGSQARDGWSKAMAAVIAVDAYRPLLDAAQEPAGLAQGGSHLRPMLGFWLPAGRFLAARVGMEAVVAAAAGQVAIADALTHADMAEVEALLRGQHAADAAHAAQPFDEQDAAWLEDAVLALVHRRRRQGQSVRSAAVVPFGGSLVFDLQLAEVRTSGPAPSLADYVAQGWLDPALTRLPLPAGSCRGLVERGWRSLDLRLQDLEDLEEAMGALFDAFDDQTAVSVAGEGFELTGTRL